jgi:ABC-type glutathione transport system ATPase component
MRRIPVAISGTIFWEPTPSLSGGESQRLRIASRLRSSQRGVLYVFDEPSTGLHPLDVATLVGVFDRLLQAGATIIVIDHDLDLLAAADHLIDMGPGGGPDGGRIVAAGTPEDVARSRQRDRPLAGQPAVFRSTPGIVIRPNRMCKNPQVDRDGPEVARLMADVAVAVSRRAAAVSDDVYEVILREIPELHDDESVLALLASSVHSNIGTCLQIMQHQISLSAVQAPTASLEYARRRAQRGTPLPALLRAYRLGHTC